jgi:HAE1 family hydrophobic/amphiphilic exporter-1
MMTTMAAMFGTLPIAVGWGAGAELRQPLGLAWSAACRVAAADALHHAAIYLTSNVLGERLGAGRGSTSRQRQESEPPRAAAE